MTNQNDAFSDAELRQSYWDAQAQFGPFEVGPDEFVRRCREGVKNLTLRNVG